MDQDTFKRKLTTIFSADAVGYSKLMGDDEASTVKTITAYQKIMTDLIMQHMVASSTLRVTICLQNLAA